MAYPTDWLADVVAWLESDMDAGTLGTDLFRFQHPANFNPATLCRVVQPVTGSTGDRSIGFQRPTMQIVTRCKTPATAWQEAIRLYNALTDRDLGPLKLGTGPPYTLIYSIQALQAPFFLGQDEAQAHEFSASYELDLVAE